jgi:hypothetical protein
LGQAKRKSILESSQKKKHFGVKPKEKAFGVKPKENNKSNFTFVIEFNYKP